MSDVNGRYIVDTVASFMCDGGYSRIGVSSRTCQNSGNWNGPAAICNLSNKLSSLFAPKITQFTHMH